MGEAQPTTAPSTNRSTIAQRELMLRRVAVVLSSLPAPTATRLLNKVSAQARHIVHQAVATLPPIDASEREEVVDTFADRIRSDVSARIMSSVADVSGVQDEIVIGQDTATIDHHDSAHLRSFGQLGSLESEPVDKSPFAFLENTSTDSLLELLQSEHPQTIALVLASISPKQAADVLPALDSKLQAETLSRIGRLDEVHEETVAELADHLQNQLSLMTAEPVSSGKRALKAIIAQLPELAQHTAADQPDETTHAPIETEPAHELRIAPETRSMESVGAAIEPVNQVQTKDRPALSVHNPEETVTEDRSADKGLTEVAIDNEKVQSFLVGLPPEELVVALGQVSTREAFLTLCGLPNATSERAIALLPRGKAKTVRRSMAQLSDLQLSDIDEAKMTVAQVAFKTESKHRKRAA